MPHVSDKKIVVIGGGTGNFAVLSGLKHYFKHITALVSMADDGGSTGQLRDELGVLPPGDVRQCLVALSDAPVARQLFDYRFGGGGLSGHNFGNIFLSAMEKVTGSFSEGVKLASEVLRTHGTVLPITTDQVKLVWFDASGNKVVGEYIIGDMDFGKTRRPKIALEPQAKITPEAHRAILDADVVVISPGDLYASIGAALVVEGVAEAIRSSKATRIYVCNLVTKPKQTDGFTVSDYAEEIERFMGFSGLDVVIYNTDNPDGELQEKYTHQGEHMVAIDSQRLEAAHYTSIGKPLVAMEPIVLSSADPIAHTRSLIRHDSDHLAEEILKIAAPGAG